jgi:threonine dehydrogenase-like Zn-dependent dehydrogenase
VVVFGAGPIGIFAAKSAWLMGAGRVIVVDEVEYRLEFVKRYAQCEVVNFREVNDMAEHIKKMTDWMGADVCIDCVGCEAAGSIAQTLTGRYMKMQAGAATVLHWASTRCARAATCRSSACTARPSTRSRSATR